MKFSHAILLTVLASDAERDPVVTDEDRAVAAQVVVKKDEMCAKVSEVPMTEDEKAGVRSTLEGSAGVDAEGLHPVESFLRNYEPGQGGGDPLALLGISVSDILFASQGAIFAILLCVFMTCCYHQLCCRCLPPKSKDTAGCQKNSKIGFSFCSGAAAFAILISVFVAPRGQLVAGSDRIFCTMGEMADVSMSGVGEDGRFPGFLSICEDIESLLTGVLSVPKKDASGVYTNPDDFIPSARAIMLDTEGLDRALGVVTSSLDRIKANSDDPKNLYIDPATCPAGVVCSGHKNVLLQEMGPKIQGVKEGLENSAAGVLGTVKEGAADFLSDENLDVLFGTVDQGMLAPLRAVKESFVGAMAEQVTRDDGIPALISQNMGQLESLCSTTANLMLPFAIAAFVLIFLLFTKAPDEKAEGKDRYPNYNHRCAFCTCLCGWECTLMVCIASAAVSLIAWPYSSGCLVLLDLSKDSMENYPVFADLTSLESAMGIMDSCIFPGGDGDFLGAIKVPFNDTETGEMTTISARGMISESIKGAVDEIFAPLQTMNEGDDEEMDGLGDLKKVLLLLGNASSFYSYNPHEVEDGYPSLTALYDATGSKAVDYDPRASDQSCSDQAVACPALPIRMRLASLACESMVVPPGSFEGQPDEAIQGLGYVLESVNSYPRDDGLATQVSCETVDEKVILTTVTAPLCDQDDPGMCAAKCDGDATCLAYCTGSITDPIALSAAQAANPAVADGFDSTEQSKFCPPIAALRLVSSLVAMSEENLFKCVDFDCPGSGTLADCAVFDEPSKKFKVPMKPRLCSMAEMIQTFQDAGDTLKTAISDVETAGDNFAPAIATELRGLIDAKMVNPFLGIIDPTRMDCGFLVTAWAKFLEGACYNLGGAVASYANIFTLCAQCGFFLVLMIFGLWRHLLDMNEAAHKEAAGGGEAKEAWSG
jgi:hypothetical protein